MFHNFEGVIQASVILTRLECTRYGLLDVVDWRKKAYTHNFCSCQCSQHNYTKYDICCHMIFSVTMITFRMTLLMIKFTNTVMGDG